MVEKVAINTKQTEIGIFKIILAPFNKAITLLKGALYVDRTQEIISILYIIHKE